MSAMSAVRLDAIKAQLRIYKQASLQGGELGDYLSGVDIDWLVGEVERLRQGNEFSRMHAEMVGLHKGFEVKEAEVERLRGLLARLEWGRDSFCIACGGFRYESETFTHGHEPGCWLAAELRP